MKNYTGEQFTAVQNIYEYFNSKMWGGKLNNCLLNFSRKSKAYGFFAPNRWTAKAGKDTVHEISLNPEYLSRDAKAVISTLVHEQAHLWQQDHGKPSPGYHNKQWADKMKEIGLYPSSTGQPGGKEIGKNCSHYVIEGGMFETLFNDMPKEFIYPLVCHGEGVANRIKKANKNKTKYTCSCDNNIWGKEGLCVTCDDCGEQYAQV